VGNSAFNPVKITNKNNNADLFGVRVLDEVYENGTSGNVLSSKPRIKRTWDISKANSNNGGVDFEFTWNAGEEDNLNSNHKLFHYGTRWDLQTGTTSVSGTTLTYTGYTGTFSPFAIGSDVTPLPITLLAFEAEKSGANALLTWTTDNEINNAHFEVLKSTDGQTWEQIGEVQGAGTSYAQNSYNFTDTRFQGLAYYKLRQVDFDGNFSYSPIRMLHSNTGNGIADVKLYPNPNNGSFTVHVEGNATFELLDAKGARIQAGNMTQSRTFSQLAAGMYLLKLNCNGQVITNKIIVE
jgi:hypothetical protein